jgi:hypothetical protein
MKRYASLTILVVVVSLMFATTVFANNSRKGHGNCCNSECKQTQSNYDLKTVETITGEIISIDMKESKKGNSKGIHLVLKTEKENIDVHLGPSWFIEKKDFKFNKNDKVTIKGSLIKLNEKPAIIAAEIKKEGNVLELRNEKGLPLWRGKNKK